MGKARNPNAKPTIQSYLVLSPLRVSADETVPVGETIEMDADEAQELVDAKVLQPKKAAAKPEA